MSSSTELFLTNETANNSSATHPEQWWREPRWLWAALLTALSAVTVAGNCLVIAAVATKSYLRNSNGYLIVSLAAADLIIGAAVMPVAILHQTAGYVWLLGTTMCDVWHVLDILACTASIWSLCVISLDRYVSSCQPIIYRQVTHARHIAIAIGNVWLLSVLVSAPAVVWWRHSSPHLYASALLCPFPDDTAYVLSSSLISFYVPLVIIVAAYLKVFRVAVLHSRDVLSGGKQLKPAHAPSNTINVAGDANTTLNGSGGGGGVETLRMHKGSRSPGGGDNLLTCPGAGDRLLSISKRMAMRQNSKNGGILSPRTSRRRSPVPQSPRSCQTSFKGRPVCLTVNGDSDVTVSSSSANGGDTDGPTVGLAPTPPAANQRPRRRSSTGDVNDFNINVTFVAATVHEPQSTSPRQTLTTSQSCTPDSLTVSVIDENAKLISSSATSCQPDVVLIDVRNGVENRRNSKLLYVTGHADVPSSTVVADFENNCFSPRTSTACTLSVTPKFTFELDSGDTGRPDTDVARQETTNAAARNEVGGSGGDSVKRRWFDVARMSSMYSFRADAVPAKARVSPHRRWLRRAHSHTSVVAAAAANGGQPSSTGGIVREPRVSPVRRARANASRMLRFARDQRAAHTLSIVVGCFVACWLPFFTLHVWLVLVREGGGAAEKTNATSTLFTVLTWLGYANSALNPVIYSRFSKDFRRAFKQMLGRREKNLTTRELIRALNAPIGLAMPRRK